MIYGNISNLDDYSFLDDKIKKCFEYYKTTDMINLDLRSHEIDGKNLFVNIASYETSDIENRFWEAHKDYLDLHMVIDGQERINLNFIENMDLFEYKKDEDYQALDGEYKASVNLENGDFLICYPSDAHMTGLKVKNSKIIKKAIFKIKIDK